MLFNIFEAQEWLLEIMKALGGMFLHPLLYWNILLLLVVGSIRINRERRQFGFKVFPMFYELLKTWLPSLIAGIFISLMFIGVGIVIPVPTLLLLAVVTILLSLHMKYTMLSASYTIGITYVLIILSPFILQYQDIVDFHLFTNTPFMSLSLLIGILLMLEAFYLVNEHRNKTFPKLTKSSRGMWIGEHELTTLSLIPLLFIIPTEQVAQFFDFLPYYPHEGASYSLLLIPFPIGYHISVQSALATERAKRLALQIGILGFVIVILSLSSIYLIWLSFLAVIVAIVGREFIIYKHRSYEAKTVNYFTKKDNGLHVLSIIPDSPAERLGILTGETIVKVNDIPVQSVNDFYEALQQSGANYRLSVIDDMGEVRIVQSALFAGEHYKLGLIFVDEPYDQLGKEMGLSTVNK
ncbi:MAG TPA: PDZ domain-containing protein [Bacillota bacterium]|nr:PDZ domain-containing protein [Bacillota bacterium]